MEMSIFNFFKFTKKRPAQFKVVNEIIKSELYRQFEKSYISSIQLKDKASLVSALRIRQEATELVRNIPALYCLGKHHEMILEYNHLGQGVEARESVLESLKNEEEFLEISQFLCSKFAFDYYTESMDYAAFTSSSYEESLHYLRRLNEKIPNEANKRKLDDCKKMQGKYGRWHTAQRSILATFCSRVSAEQDKGRYAAGLSIIDIILYNAEKTGYNLDYEEYVDLLDDMCAISIQYLMQKMQCRPQVRTMSEDAFELGRIIERPISYLAGFISDCLPNHQSLFENYFKGFAAIPWINDLSEWKKLRQAMGKTEPESRYSPEETS